MIDPEKQFTKDGIRREMRVMRKAVTPDQRASVSDVICAKLLRHPDVQVAILDRTPIAVYIASKDEIDLTGFINAAMEKGALLVAPRWNGSVYELAPFRSLDDLVPGPHAIPEPPAPAINWQRPRFVLFITPGLAFTVDGKRIGYGGGWYDRLFASGDSCSVKLGVAYHFQLVDDIPIEPHDILLDEIVTE